MAEATGHEPLGASGTDGDDEREADCSGRRERHARIGLRSSSGSRVSNRRRSRTARRVRSPDTHRTPATVYRRVPAALRAHASPLLRSRTRRRDASNRGRIRATKLGRGEILQRRCGRARGFEGWVREASCRRTRLRRQAARPGLASVPALAAQCGSALAWPAPLRDEADAGHRFGKRRRAPLVAVADRIWVSPVAAGRMYRRHRPRRFDECRRRRHGGAAVRPTNRQRLNNGARLRCRCRRWRDGARCDAQRDAFSGGGLGDQTPDPL